MQQPTTTEIIESTLLKLSATRWDGDGQALYDYPNQQANPHFHFAFDTSAIADSTQVTVSLLSRGNNFRKENGFFVDFHITSLGVFPLDGFVKLLEGLSSARKLEIQ